MAVNDLDTDDLLKQYINGSIILREAIAGLSEAALDDCLNEQSWTIRQIVHHIADGDDLWKTCIKASLSSNEPFSMKWYWDVPQDSWAEIWKYDKREIEASLNLLQANRECIYQLLCLIPNALQQSVTIKWPEGEQSGMIGDVIKMQVAHIIGHVAEINKIREAHGLELA
jgi:uncharacterized damage-inducible protein DinB